MAASKIRHPRRAKQLIDFKGLQWGALMPTDIDLAIEFGGRLFVFGDAKLKGQSLSTGQRILYERLVDQIGPHAFVFVCSHTTPVDEPIDIAEAVITEHRWGGGRWEASNAGVTVREAIDKLRDHFGL